MKLVVIVLEKYFIPVHLWLSGVIQGVPMYFGGLLVLITNIGFVC
jgi:hypothetical protein